jgi:uncharacterized protein (DUF433 family)
MTIENHAHIAEPRINEGVYLLRDVSEILLIRTAKINRWLKDFWDGRYASEFSYSFGDKGNRAVNFYTLIEFHTFYQLRTRGISSQKIHKIHRTMANDLKTPYPFAGNIRTDGKAIWYEFLDSLIKADGKQQLDCKAIIAPFLEQIDFGADNLAARYFPLKKSRNVVVDPKHQFGQPTVTGRNIRLDVIRKLSEGGETTENICILYDLKASQVEDALQYYKRTG